MAGLRKEQAKERKEWEDIEAQKKADAEEEGTPAFIPDTKKFPLISPKPFKTYKVQYVVCLNTMGQDRKYSESEKLFALRCVQAFRDRWEILD